MFKQKLYYFYKCIFKRLCAQKKQCPSCGAFKSELLQKKYWITELRKCGTCKLMFRFPLDSSEDNEKFYQKEYSQGFTTDFPNDEELKIMLEKKFGGYERDYKKYIEILKSLKISVGASVIDFGCSWGYGVWQLNQAGYDAKGFEISHHRAIFGRKKLLIPIFEKVEQITEQVDVFFSCHVLEHVPSIHGVVRNAKKWLKPNGLFIAFTPNGSIDFRFRNEKKFNHLWGMVHPNFLADEFYKTIFNKKPLLIDSSPYNVDEISKWDRKCCQIEDLSGHELMVVTVLKKN